METRKSVAFKLMKWLLISVCFVVIVLTIIAAYFGIIFIATILEEYKSFMASIYGHDFNYDTLKIVWRIYIIIVAIINIVFYLIGVIGALKSNYCFVITFAIYMTVHSFTASLLAFHSKLLWITCVISILITVLAFALAIEIFKTKYQKLVEVQPLYEIPKHQQQYIIPMSAPPPVVTPDCEPQTSDYSTLQFRMRHLS